MRERIRSTRPLATALVILWLVALVPQPAGAAVTSGVADGVLTISGDDADDRVQVGCGGDAVTSTRRTPARVPPPAPRSPRSAWPAAPATTSST
jgi:hypothetical protein